MISMHIESSIRLYCDVTIEEKIRQTWIGRFQSTLNAYRSYYNMHTLCKMSLFENLESFRIPLRAF
jgi:hypothetical protein